MTKFKAALDSGKFKAKVDADAKEGADVGATGTPTFFINGTKVVGAQPFESFKSTIDAELKAKG
jgi:protein-disulfide isomerase